MFCILKINIGPTFGILTGERAKFPFVTTLSSSSLSSSLYNTTTCLQFINE